MAAAVFLSDQELIYISMGLRALARDARADAEKADSLVIRDHHLNAAETYERLAEKYDELRTTARR